MTRRSPLEITEDLPQVPVPERLGSAELGRFLGRGATASVYEATLLEGTAAGAAGTIVAVKILHPWLAGDEVVRDRFSAEARIGARVASGEVVRTFGEGLVEHEGASFAYLVQELAPGQTLRQLLDEAGSLPEPLARALGAGIARGLAALHAVGVAHGDLKPANVLITPDHRVKIADFGCARVEGDSRDRRAFHGSLHHAAPERFLGADATPAADLYALGVILFEMLAGTNPFAATDPVGIRERHLRASRPSLAAEAPRASALLVRLTAGLLETAPSRRPESATSCVEALEQGEHSAWWATVDRTIAARACVLPPSTGAFVGRHRELELALEALARAAAGHGSALAILGGAGMGKSRLVSAIMDTSTTHASRPLVLYASEAAGAGAESGSRSLLARFAPAHEGDGAARVADVVLRDLRALAGENPVLLVVDDVHAATATTTRVLGEIVRAAQDASLLVVLTARNDTEDGLFGACEERGHLQRIHLDSLSADEADQLVEAELGVDLAVPWGPALFQRSAGHPFHLRALLADLRERQPSEPAGTTVPRGNALPSSIREALASRLLACTPAEREILDAAAVQGLSFDATVTAEVLGLPALSVLRTLLRLERRLSLIQSDGGDTRFEHQLLHDFVVDALPPDLARDLHARTARVLDARRASGASSASAPDVARHALAGSLGALALTTIDDAVAVLRAAHRHEEIVRLVEAALPLLDDSDVRRCVSLRVARVEALHGLGRRDHERSAIDELDAFARSADDLGGRAQASLRAGQLAWALSRHADAATRLAEAVEQADASDLPDVALRSLRRLAEVRQGQGQRDVALALLAEARRRATLLGDRSSDAEVAFAEGHLHFARGAHLAATASYAEARRIAHDIGEVELEARSLGNLALVSVNENDRATAEPMLREALRLFVSVGDRRGEATMLSNLARIAKEDCRFDEARRLLRRCLALRRALGDRRGESIAVSVLANIALVEGRMEEAADLVGRRCELAHELKLPGDIAASEQLCGELAEARGDDAARLVHLLVACELRRSTGERLELMRTLRRVASCHLDRGERRQAEACLDEIVAIARDLDMTPVATARCLLAVVGRFDGATLDEGTSLVERAQIHVTLAKWRGEEGHWRGALEALRRLSRHLAGRGRRDFWRWNPVARTFLRLPRPTK